MYLLRIPFFSSFPYGKAGVIQVAILNSACACRTGEYMIHLVVACSMYLCCARCSEAVCTSISKRICQESIIHSKTGACPIIWLPSWSLCSVPVLLKGPGPLAEGTAVCLLLCLLAFRSPPPSLNSTFLCSVKALHSKDLTTQEWVLLPFLSSFFLPVLLSASTVFALCCQARSPFVLSIGLAKPGGL